MEIGAISHASIDVHLSGEDDARLPGVTGTLRGGVIDRRTEVSDARGHMVFDTLPPGTYLLSFSHTGYAEETREVTVHETDEHDPLEIKMKRRPN